MPPRIELFSTLRNGFTQLHNPRLLGISTPRHASRTLRKRRRFDPYTLAQAKARKQANISRQETLREERAKALGDPVRGITTPFLESFDTAIPVDPSILPLQPKSDAAGTASTQVPIPETPLNHFIQPAELEAALARSAKLTTPILRDDATADPEMYAKSVTSAQQGDARAREALRRITAIANGSSFDKLHANMQRCITTFGRHVTDGFLQPRPEANPLRPSVKTLAKIAKRDGLEAAEAAANKVVVNPAKTPRVGPDTGSSEVQIAILTAKIRALAGFLEGPGRRDKANKRNLRLLVHRRQKLLKYLRRKERGGERWQFVTETLGLTEGTWRGEITL